LFVLSRDLLAAYACILLPYFNTLWRSEKLATSYVVGRLHHWGCTRALRQGGIAMKEAGSAEQFRLFQQELVLAGEAIETLKRDQRAAMDALRLEVEVLKHCVCQVHPELAAQFETIRADRIREFDPEAS
jgi:hypothetical protein